MRDIRAASGEAASSVGVGSLSTPALRTARGFAYYAGTQMLFRVLLSVFSLRIFEQKRDCSQSNIQQARIE